MDCVVNTWIYCIYAHSLIELLFSLSHFNTFLKLGLSIVLLFTNDHYPCLSLESPVGMPLLLLIILLLLVEISVIIKVKVFRHISGHHHIPNIKCQLGDGGASLVPHLLPSHKL